MESREGRRILEVTPEASAFLKRRYGAERLAGAYLRVVFHVRDSEPAHGLVPEREKRVSDAVIEVEGVRFLVGVDSLELVAGSTIDYDEDADEVLILNPNIEIKGVD